MTIRRALLLILMLCLGGGRAEAGKLVGVVFDDSGSMGPSHHLPLLGLQMLAATLDGRQGGDRLLVTKFGWLKPQGGEARIGRDIGSNVREIPIGSQDEIQNAVGEFARWPVKHADTPYAPLRSMLATLAEQAVGGQEAHLIVITDGAFEPPPPGQDRVRADFEAARADFERKGVRIRAHFVLIANGQASGPKDGASLRDRIARQKRSVEEQGVRAELLRTFNGAAQAGSYVVEEFADLRDRMLEIIARVSETDIGHASSVARPSGDHRIALDLPFAVSRVIALSTGPGAAPGGAPSLARLQEIRPLGAGGAEGGRIDADRIETSGAMAGADTLETWKGQGVLAFRATQLAPRPFLQPGRYAILFDRETDDGLRLLFRTDLNVAWSLKEGEKENEREVARSGEPGRTVSVPAARDLTLDVTVRDRNAGDQAAGGRIVNFRDFPKDAVFRGHLVDPEGRRTLIPLTLDRDRASVRGTVRFPRAGAYRLDVEMTVAGAPSTSSGLFTVEARFPSEFALGIEPPGTGDGQSFTVRTPAGILPPGSDPRIVTLTVTPKDAPRDAARSAPAGTVHIGLAGLPDGVEAVHGGTVLGRDGVLVPFRGGQPIPIVLRRTAAWRGYDERGPVTARAVIDVEERGGSGGGVHGTVEIAAVPGEARLTYRGHDGQPAEGVPAPMPIRDLDGRSRTLDFALDGAVVPPKPEDFALELSDGLGGWVTAQVQVTPGAPGTPSTIRVPPNTWCPYRCLLVWRQGPHTATLAYRPGHGLQNAAGTAAFVLDDAGGGGRTVCLWLLLALLVLIQILGWIGFMAFAYRFPKRAVLSIESPNALAEIRRLKAARSTALRAALWFPRLFVAGRSGLRIREAHTREGLRLLARPGGVDALPAGKSWPNLKLESIGETLANESPIEPGRRPSPVTLPWGSILIGAQPRRVLGIWQRSGDVQPHVGMRPGR